MASQNKQRRTKRKLLAGIVTPVVAFSLIALGAIMPAHADDDPPPVVDPVGTLTEGCVDITSVLTASGTSGTYAATAFIGVNGVEVASVAVAENSPFSFSHNVALPEGTAYTADLQFGDVYGAADVLDSGSFTVDCVDDPPPPVDKEEVGFYIYQKLDNSDPASWENSGEQEFCGSQTGTDWFATVPCVLPQEVCGDGWAYQQDKVKDWAYDGSFNWPTNIQYPVDNIGWPPIYDAKHGELSELITVPPCSPPPTPVEITAGPSVTDPTCDADGTLVIPTIEHVTFAGGVNGDGPGDYTITASAETGYTLTGDVGPWNRTVLPKKTDASCDPPPTPSVCTAADTLPTSTNLNPQGAVLSDTSTVKYVDGGLQLESDNWVDAYVTFATNFELKDLRDFFMDITVADLGGAYGFAPIFHTSLGNIHGEALYSDELWTNSPGILPVTGGGQGGPYSGSLEDALAIGNPTVTSVSFLFTSATPNSAILSQGGYNCLIQPFDYEAAPTTPPVPPTTSSLPPTGQQVPIALWFAAGLMVLLGAALVVQRLRPVEPADSVE